MSKKQRQQKRDGKPPSSSGEKVVGEGKRPAPEVQDELGNDDAHVEEEEYGGDGEGDERSQREKSLRDFLKHAKGQHYRVVETRVALVCSFGVFAKLIFSDALVDGDDDSFITHSAVTFAGCK